MGGSVPPSPRSWCLLLRVAIITPPSAGSQCPAPSNTGCLLVVFIEHVPCMFGSINNLQGARLNLWIAVARPAAMVPSSFVTAGCSVKLHSLAASAPPKVQINLKQSFLCTKAFKPQAQLFEDPRPKQLPKPIAPTQAVLYTSTMSRNLSVLVLATILLFAISVNA